MIVIENAGIEIKRIFKGVLGKVVLAALLLVPILYGALYLWAFWDPYSAIDHMPVALINQDVAAKTESGERVDVGKDIVQELLEKNTFEWHVVTASQADRGLKNGDYYLSLTIPRNFSSNLATANTENPKPAQIYTKAQMSDSFLAEQIGNRVFGEVRTAASTSASKEYFNQIFLGFGDSRASLTKAAKGANKLGNGLKDARDGAGELKHGLYAAKKGARKLSAGSGDLAGGIDKLNSGAAHLAGGTKSLKDNAVKLNEGASKLDAGAKKLNTGVASVGGGAVTLSAGSQTLAEGTIALDSGLKQLLQGTGQVKEGTKQATSSLSLTAQEVEKLKKGTEANAQLVSGMAAAIESLSGGAPSDDLKLLMAQASTTAGAVDGGVGDLQKGLGDALPNLEKLEVGAAQVDSGAAQLSAGASALRTGSSSLNDGVKALKTGTSVLREGASSLVDGSSQLAEGTSALESGASTLDSGAHKVVAGLGDASVGAHKINDGTADLINGLTKLHAGAGKLEAGLEPAITGSEKIASGLYAGVKDIPDYSSAERARNTAMMAKPVELDSKKIGRTDNYGTGFAPYFLPLALWVGALVGYLLLNPLPRAKGKKKSWYTAFTRTVAGFVPMALLALLQCTVLILVVEFGLGLDPVYNGAFWTVLIVSALTFTAILQLLNAAFGPAGKLAAIVILMLQLTSAAGTFPIELLDPFFQALHPLMPMSYIVAALRSAISGGAPDHVLSNLGTIVGFGVGAFMLTMLAARGRITDMAERLSEKVGI